LTELRKSDPQELTKLLARLRKMAEVSGEVKLSTVKRLGNRGLVQIAGNSCRVFCFYDQDSITIVCVDLFHIGSGNKAKNQNAAIDKAESLMNRWRSAEPVPDQSDLRLEL
jgi:hypothetical protein